MKNIISRLSRCSRYSRFSRVFVFVIAFVFAWSVSLPNYAQDDLEDDLEQLTVKKRTVAVKKYQTRKISGKVIDAATKKPISGAIVSASDVSGYSALTGDDGTYTLDVPVFSSSVFITDPDHGPQTLGLASGEQQKEVRLYVSTFADDYDAQTNVLVNHSAKDFGYSNAINSKEDIQKDLGAYAYTTNRNGTVGVGTVMFVQGLNSLNANAQPLIVVDGVILEQQYDREMLHSGFFNDILSTINPSDIEKITVVRNATALYGARGANGVILIDTRRNKSMATRITASASVGITTLPKFIDMMDAEQYRGYASELLKTTGTRINQFKFLNEDPTYYYYNQYHNNTDWKDEVYRKAMTQNYGINIEGGDEVANYNLSVGYTSANSTLKYNDFSRLNIRFNTDINMTDRFKVRFDASFGNITRNIRNDGAPSGYDEGTPTSPSFLAYVKAPFMSPYSYGKGVFSDTKLDTDEESYLDEALSYYSDYNYKLGNPYAINEYSEGKIKNRFENSLLNIAVTPKYEFNPHLTLSEHFSYSLVNTNEKFYIPILGTPSYYVSSVSASRTNEVRALASKQNSIQSDTRLAWNNRYDAHDIAVFGGLRMNFEKYTCNSQLGYNTGSDKTPFMSSSLLNAQDNGIDNEWRTVDLYIQANYNYLSRYYLQANITGSGSSRFGKDADGALQLLGAPWAVFPSLQAAWVMTNEPWMPKSNLLNYLRINAGYDMSGNDDIDCYVSRSYFKSNLYLNSIAGLSFSNIGNNKIKWETTRRFNVGLETHLIDNRISLGFNFFSSRTSNLLAFQTLSYLSGIEKNWANNGRLKNVGYDVSLSAKVLALKDWTWQIGGTLGHYKNTILELGLSDGQTGFNTEVYGATIRTEEGQAANLFYGYNTNGVYATSQQAADEGLYILDDNGVDHNYFTAGDVRFVDMNGDKAIDENDRVVIGDPNPDIYGNLFTSLTWKRLRLDVNFNYSLGNDVYNYMRAQLEGGNRFMNQTTALTQRWQVEGQETTVPKITFQDPMGNSRFSDRWIEDGSYLRLKTITLSYDLPLKLSFLQGLQFWVQANNLFTWSKYLGSDPEFCSSSAVIGQGIDTGCLPQSRSFVAGVKINL